jgi:bifunctional DNase/RNase
MATLTVSEVIHDIAPGAYTATVLIKTSAGATIAESDPLAFTVAAPSDTVSVAIS